MFNFRNLSDVDKDGRLSCEEFVLCMHLCELANTNAQVPQSLPPDLIPPSLRRRMSVTAMPGDVGSRRMSGVSVDSRRMSNVAGATPPAVPTPPPAPEDVTGLPIQGKSNILP